MQEAENAYSNVRNDLEKGLAPDSVQVRRYLAECVDELETLYRKNAVVNVDRLPTPDQIREELARDDLIHLIDTLATDFFHTHSSPLVRLRETQTQPLEAAVAGN